MKPLTPSELKYHVSLGKDRHFFDRKSMKFFGDTMKNYGVRSVTIDTNSRQSVECWELYRKQPVKHRLQTSAYFDKQTFCRVFLAK